MPQLADIIAEIDRDVEQYGVSRLNTPGKKKAAIGEALMLAVDPAVPSWVQDVTPLGLLAVTLWVVLNRQAAAIERLSESNIKMAETLARLEVRIKE